jgi:hypothetical protein
MFLHLGENVTVPIKDIIGIFDLETTMYGSDTNQFLRMAEEDGFVERVTEETPKSYVIAEVNKKSKVYLSQISSATLSKRTDMDYNP